jgi:hypothetical protein
MVQMTDITPTACTNPFRSSPPKIASPRDARVESGMYVKTISLAGSGSVDLRHTGAIRSAGGVHESIR